MEMQKIIFTLYEILKRIAKNNLYSKDLSFLSLLSLEVITCSVNQGCGKPEVVCL